MKIQLLAFCASLTLSACSTGPKTLLAHRSPSATEEAPAPTPSSVPEFRISLWTVREGFNSDHDPKTNSTTITWQADCPIDAPATVRKYSDPSLTAPDAAVALQEKMDLELRKKMARISTTLPEGPVPKTRDTCKHWVETEAIYGKRFYCEGYYADDAMNFVETLHQLFK